MDISRLLDDLAREQADLDDRVGPLTEAQWATPTSAEGWDVRDSVGHLCYFDETADLALVDPDAFTAHSRELLAGRLVAPDETLSRSLGPAGMLARWRASRATLLTDLRAADPGTRVPWYESFAGPPGPVRAPGLRTAGG